MKRPLLFLLRFLLIVTLTPFLYSCGKCKSNQFYIGLAGANGGDHLKILVDDNLEYENKFNDYFRWDNNDMPKLVENYCPKDTIVKIELRLINSGKDTLFNVNTNHIRGLYISTSTVDRGKFILTYDYYDGGLRDVVWDDNVHP